MPDDLAPPFDEPSEDDLPALVESLLFVADAPVTAAALARVLGAPPRQLRDALDRLGEALDGRGIRLQRGPEGVQLITAPGSAAAVEHFLGLESGRRLSTAALETLAVIAYRQPATRAAIEAIRGTSSDAVLTTLRARGLVERIGRAEGPGRPALYGTTQHFLEHFGLERAEDLPGLDELAKRLGLDAAAKATASLAASTLSVEALQGARVEASAGTPAVRSRGPASAAPALPGGGPATPGRGVTLPDTAAASRVPEPPTPGI